MALSARLELRQSQQLVMTPQLQQAIKLLQLSNLELVQFVDTELERNPLLERDDAAETGPGDASAVDDAPGETFETSLDLAKPLADPVATLDTEFDNVYPDAAPAESQQDGADNNWSLVRERSSQASAGHDPDIAAFVARDIGLRDHLAQQLAEAVRCEIDRAIGTYLIHTVDDAGYLSADVASLATALGTSEARVEAVLAVVQTFDPPGVFARSLAECLALQLKEQNRYDPVIASLLDNLKLLSMHDLASLKRIVGVDHHELTEMIAEIKRLDPKPGLRFGRTDLQTLVPDVMVRAAADRTWVVELNAETLPRVLINRTYFSRVSKSGPSPAEKTYLAECLQSATWLTKSLDQRARTILRVAEEIVRQQDAFLTHGVEYLRPLNLRTVADAISMHESTVSRVTSNKYMATPRGIFEFKYFFTSAIASSAAGEAHSSEAVRYRIRQFIDGETVKAVLSDDQIVEMLRVSGVDIARRTVAKYREAMRIPSSVQRRREKKLSYPCPTVDA